MKIAPLRVLCLLMGLSVGLVLPQAHAATALAPVSASAELTQVMTAVGHNVHLVAQGPGTLLFRGGAPTPDTLKWLQTLARQRGVPLTLVDLRTPPRPYDLNQENGRLAPDREKSLLAQGGNRYVPLSALDKKFTSTMASLTSKPGIVYFHCQYGVNRTGFALGRLVVNTGLKLDRTGVGERDFNQGVAYEQKLKKP